MHRWPTALAAAVVLSAAPAGALAQSAARPPVERPIPARIVADPGHAAAVRAGTRTATGAPGPRYWQQFARYDLRVSLDAAGKRLSGTGRIVYQNHSPDTLGVVYLHLIQNHHAPGVIRNEPAEITGGMQLSRVAVRGQALSEATRPNQPGYGVDGTIMAIRLSQPLLPGDSLPLELDWSFGIAQQGASGRMGWSRDNLFHIAYFYPQMAVYDDVQGWQIDPFLGGAEFYVGYGSYRMTVDAPAGWVVNGTGALQNADRVFPSTILDRIRRAERSDDVVHVLAAADFGAGKATLPGTNGRLTWEFRADSVRDVAFSATRESNWDAARTNVGDRDGDGRDDYARVDALWRATAPRWAQSWRYAQQSVAHHSRFTGISYPYPHMTVVEAADIIGGGMEFPMMTIIGDYNQRGDTALYSTTSHEIAHMWFPMIVSTDETRYGWMDEGTTDFNENEASDNLFGAAFRAHLREQDTYLTWIRRGVDVEEMRWTNLQIPGIHPTFSSYYKPAVNLATLRALLGKETFDPAYRAYARQWRFKHPKPWDFFAHFDAAAGRDLWWFWASWYDQAWTLDHAVASVTPGAGGSATVTVRDVGNALMPARLVVTREDGSTLRLEVPVDTWLTGVRTATVSVPAGSAVTRVEIDPARDFPDVDRANNVWTR